MNMSEQADRELVSAAQAGDKQAFGLLVERHLPMAQHVAMRMLANQEIAWELAQEAILQAYLSLNNLREADRFASWLYGIARNVCRNYLRSQKTNFISLEALSGGAYYTDQRRISAELDPQHVVEADELHHRLYEAIESLSAKNRAATELFYYEHLSLQEIAVLLGTSVNGIKGRLFQSRKQLQAQLADVYPPMVSSTHSIYSTQERRMIMIKISTIHAIETALTGNYILYLLDTAESRMLQIWVGPHEGTQIAQLLRGEVTHRPMTYLFMAGLLDTLGAKLQEVRIESLKENTFYAVVKAQNGKAVHELDARPSDALALALQMRSPIFVADAVLAQVGQPLPQPFDEQAWLQQETQHMAEVAHTVQEWEQKLKEAPGADIPSVVRVLKQAEAFAQKLKHNYIGTEHLLLSLVSDQESSATKALLALGAGQERVMEAVERLIGRGQKSLTTEPVIVPRVVHVFEMAEEERRTLGDSQIGPNHILLGLLREGQGMAIIILRDLDVDLAQVRVKLGEFMLSVP